MASFKAANGSRRANDPSPADDPAAVAFVTFFAILKVYEILLPVDTYYTVRVPKNCVLNAVAAGDDYLFDCLR